MFVFVHLVFYLGEYIVVSRMPVECLWHGCGMDPGGLGGRCWNGGRPTTWAFLSSIQILDHPICYAAVVPFSSAHVVGVGGVGVVGVVGVESYRVF